MVKQGDIVFADFSPSKGHEQQNKRPALVLSNDLVVKTSGMSIMAPISTTERNYPLYHVLKSTKKITGKVLLDQTKALDLRAREIDDHDVVEHVSKSELIKITNLYKLMFTVD